VGACRRTVGRTGTALPRTRGARQRGTGISPGSASCPDGTISPRGWVVGAPGTVWSPSRSGCSWWRRPWWSARPWARSTWPIRSTRKATRPGPGRSWNARGW